jgi:hypothetical protein
MRGQKKNTKPTIESDEQHREKLNGFLAVDVTRGDTHVEFKKHSTTAEAVFVIVLISLIYTQKDVTNLTFLLDNARIHGAKMEAGVQQLLAEIALQRTLPAFMLLFWHTPSYSPKLNPAEYVIHEVRPSTAQLDSRYRRLQRFISDAHNVDYDGVARFIMYLFGFLATDYELTLDRTNGRWGNKNINILVLAVVYKGIAIPTYWLLLNKKGNSNTKERIALLKRFIKQFGKTRIIRLLADRVVLATTGLRGYNKKALT